MIVDLVDNNGKLIKVFCLSPALTISEILSSSFIIYSLLKFDKDSFNDLELKNFVFLFISILFDELILYINLDEKQ